jgi:hypothetical protein
LNKAIKIIIAGLVISIGLIQLLVTLQILPEFSVFQNFKIALHGFSIAIKLILLIIIQICIFYLAFKAINYIENLAFGFQTIGKFAYAIGIIYLTHVYYNILWSTDIPLFQTIEYYYLLIVIIIFIILIKASYPRFSKGTL